MAHQSGSPFLPSLQRCVFSLERSTKRLKSSVEILDDATSGFPRLKTLTAYTKHFELVSEQDIKTARGEAAKDIEPHLFSLLDKSVEMVIALESIEQDLVTQVNEEMEKTRQRQQCKSAVKSGLSNIKRLQSLAERTSELSRASKDLDDLLDQKRQEFGDVIERANNYNISSAPGAKRIRRLSNTRSQGLQKTEESKEEDIRRCEEEIKALKQKIADKRKELARSKNAHTDVLESLATMKVPSEFNPNDIWDRYMAQYDFFVAALQSELRIAAKDKSAYDATMTHIAKAYDQELREIIDMTQNNVSVLSLNKERKLSQLQALCKQFFPRDSLGTTMVRVLALLLESPQKECYYSDLVMNHFPPNEEKRHSFRRVMEILKNLGLIEVMHEVREIDDVEAAKELVVRIKFDDSAR